MNDAVSIAAAVREGKVSAVDVTKAALARIAARDNQLNCFTAVTAKTALTDAARIDREIAQGKNTGVLAGVPFAVKNLFDIGRANDSGGVENQCREPSS